MGRGFANHTHVVVLVLCAILSYSKREKESGESCTRQLYILRTLIWACYIFYQLVCFVVHSLNLRVLQMRSVASIHVHLTTMVILCKPAGR